MWAGAVEGLPWRQIFVRRWVLAPVRKAAHSRRTSGISRCNPPAKELERPSCRERNSDVHCPRSGRALMFSTARLEECEVDKPRNHLKPGRFAQERCAHMGDIAAIVGFCRECIRQRSWEITTPAAVDGNVVGIRLPSAWLVIDLLLDRLVRGNRRLNSGFIPWPSLL